MKEIGLKAFEKQDLPACLGVESAAMGKHLYLKDVAEYYTTTKGEFTLALVEDKVVGMGKLTVLFDGSAWLELLRVHPDFQRQGVGAKIYTRYLEQATAFRCPAIRMYTGAKNIPSAALAQKNGLHRGPEFCSMTLNLQNIPWEKEHLQGFCLANGQQAQELLLPMKEQAGWFFSINHTFYAVNPATCKGMAAAGWVYCAGENALVLGARFQPEKVWHGFYRTVPLGSGEKPALCHSKGCPMRSGKAVLPLSAPKPTAAFAAGAIWLYPRPFQRCSYGIKQGRLKAFLGGWGPAGTGLEGFQTFNKGENKTTLQQPGLL